MWREIYNQRKQDQQERMMNNVRLKETIERIVGIRKLFRSNSKDRKRDAARIKALASVQKTLESAIQVKARNVQTVYNVALYLLQLDQDLAFFASDMVRAIGDRKRAYVAKQGAVLLYEAAEDIPQLLGQKFRKAMGSLDVEEDQLGRINSISAALNAFWREHRQFLGQIRNILSAHREHDALLYAEKLNSVDPLVVMGCAAKFSGLLEQLVQELARMASVTPSEILRDVLISAKGKASKH